MSLAFNTGIDKREIWQIAEATVLVNKAEVHASSEAKDMYEAIDLLVDKLDRQLIRHKEKIKDHRD